jgi:hypothetical protein
MKGRWAAKGRQSPGSILASFRFKETRMKVRYLIVSAIVLLATGLEASSAFAFERTVTLTTPRGTYTKSASGGCAGAVCTRDAEITGPNGHTVSRSGSCAAGRWFYGCTGTLTGPNGHTLSRSGSCAAGWWFYGCTGTVIGPNGHSITRHVVGRRSWW